MKALIIAEHDNTNISASTYNTITAARCISSETDLLVAGFETEEVVKSATKIPGLSGILNLDNLVFQHGLAEPLSELVAKVGKLYTHILAPASFHGKNFMPRVSALLDVQQISDITGILDERTFIRPTYAGNAIAKVESFDKIKCLTVRPTGFDPANSDGGNTPVKNLDDLNITSRDDCTFICEDLNVSERPELGTAKIVISGGRGIGSAEAFMVLESLADKLGAAVGASRAAVDAGFVPNDYQVGQTGKIVAPDLYFAVGISGAIQHLAGMKDSKIIVAINTDQEAPIFQIADFGLVMDWEKALNELSARV